MHLVFSGEQREPRLPLRHNNLLGTNDLHFLSTTITRAPACQLSYIVLTIGAPLATLLEPA